MANRRLAEHVAGGAPRGMGATLTAVLFGPGRPIIANVGDCRTYLMDDQGLRQLTKDHSWVAEQVESGFLTPETARVHPWRHMVTRAVQGEPGLQVDTVELSSDRHARLLLCSDGLHAVVPDERIAAILARTADPPAAICQALIAAANEGGAPDNVSVIVLDCPAGPALP